MTRSLFLSALLAGSACSGAPSLSVPTPSLPSTPPTATPALYEPEQSYTVSDPVLLTVESPDAIAGTRSVPIAVRWPIGADGPRPVVIWSHGGGDGKTNPLRSGPEWGASLAAAGYVAVSVAHPPRPRGQMAALCQHVGYTSRDECTASFRSVKYDRQHDLIAVIDWVEEQATDPAWSGRLDASRIALAGHSAGSGGVAELAGAVRLHGPADTGGREDRRPLAFLLLALQGPDEQKGFAEDAWDAIDRPVFGATGLGDITESTVPENRVRVFDSLDSDGSRLLWIEDEATAHTVFNLETAGCERRGATRRHCEALVDIVRSSALAFLDAHVAGRRAARRWLDETDLRDATDGTAWWLAP